MSRAKSIMCVRMWEMAGKPMIRHKTALLGLAILLIRPGLPGFVSFYTGGPLRAASATGQPAPATGLDKTAETKWVGKIIGPDKYENNCSSCHVHEFEAWQRTRHYATFKDRHRSDEADVILENMGQKSMKRIGVCRQCHYTSKLKKDKIRASWGVSCESCHGPALHWGDIHNKIGGEPSGQAIQWGAGKNEAKEARASRLGAAQAKGLIHSDMIYDIATNCFGCHTVPNETLVNKGKHKAGSDFDLVVWSQGEIRHNFSSSTGAPDHPTNRPSSAEQQRRLYVVGAMVDLEFSLRNLASVNEKGKAFHHAMIERVNRARKKINAVLQAVDIPELATTVNALPASVDASTSIDAAVPASLSEASKRFVAKYDGSELSAVDSLIPTEVKGEAYKE